MWATVCLMMVTGVSGRWRPPAPVQVTAHHNQTLISDVPVQCWDYKREDRIPAAALEDAAFPLVHRCRCFIVDRWESWGQTEQIQQFVCKNSQAFVCLFFHCLFVQRWMKITFMNYFFWKNHHLFFAWSPQLCWWVSVMSALMGIPCPVMGPCSRTIDSGCANRPSKQLWGDVMSNSLLCTPAMGTSGIPPPNTLSKFCLLRCKSIYI